MYRKIFLFLFLVSSVFCAQAARVAQIDLSGVLAITLTFSAAKETYLVEETPSKSYMVRHFFHDGSYDVVQLYGSPNDVAEQSAERFFAACKELHCNPGSVTVTTVWLPQ